MNNELWITGREKITWAIDLWRNDMLFPGQTWSLMVMTMITNVLPLNTSKASLTNSAVSGNLRLVPDEENCRI